MEKEKEKKEEEKEEKKVVSHNIYMGDNETKTLPGRDELEGYFRYLGRADDKDDLDNGFFPVFTNTVSVFAIRNEPLLMASACAAPKVCRRGKWMETLPPLDPDDPVIRETIEGSGLFLVLPFDKASDWNHVIPVAECAFQSVLERAGDTGSVMQRATERGGKQALDVARKAKRLTEDFSLSADSDLMYVVLRDGKARAALSKVYVRLPVEEMIGKVENQLDADHPDWEFAGAMASHAGFSAKYRFKDFISDEAMKQMLKDAGFNAGSVSSGLRLSTSDIGQGAARVTAFCEVDGLELSLGNELQMQHSGSASMEKFAEMLQETGNMLHECDLRMEQLCNMPVKDPGATLLKVYDIKKTSKKGHMLRKEVVEKVAEALHKEGTGMDVFIALNECARRRSEAERMGASGFLQLSEFTSSLMYLPFDLIEKGQYVEA